jgi:hypothetical protein
VVARTREGVELTFFHGAATSSQARRSSVAIKCLTWDNDLPRSDESPVPLRRAFVGTQIGTGRFSTGQY